MKSRHSSYNFSPKNTFPRVINNQESERGERPNKPETNLNPFWLHLMSSDGQFDVFHIQIRSEMGKHVNHMNMQAIELAFLSFIICYCVWLSLQLNIWISIGNECWNGNEIEMKSLETISELAAKWLSIECVNCTAVKTLLNWLNARLGSFGLN